MRFLGSMGLLGMAGMGLVFSPFLSAEVLGLDGLSSPDFAVREKATAELARQLVEREAELLPALLRLRESTEDPELLARLRGVIEDLFAQYQPGFLGVRFQAVNAADPWNQTVVIVACEPGSPAHRAGLKAGDVIRQVEHYQLEARRPAESKPPTFTDAVQSYQPGQEISFEIRRENRQLQKRARLVGRVDIPAFRLPEHQNPEEVAAEKRRRKARFLLWFDRQVAGLKKQKSSR